MFDRLFAVSATALFSVGCGSVTEPQSELVDANVAVAIDATLTDATPQPLNLIRNGDFETDGTLHWTPVDTSLSVEAGALRLEQTVQGGPGLAWQLIDNVNGKTLRLETTFVAGSYFSSIQVRVGTGINDSSFANIFEAESVIEFISTSPSIWVTLNNVSIEVGEYGVFDNVRITEVQD